MAKNQVPELPFCCGRGGGCSDRALWARLSLLLAKMIAKNIRIKTLHKHRPRDLRLFKSPLDRLSAIVMNLTIKHPPTAGLTP